MIFMEMIHHGQVISKALKALSPIVEQDSEMEAYLVQNVYGRLTVYLKCNNPKQTSQISSKLSEGLGPWFQTCELYDNSNLFVKNELEHERKITTPICSRIWLFEKYLTSAYWDDQLNYKHSKDLTGKLVSFYSFKGGVGRTTAMVMTAMSLAQMGKRIVLIDFDLEAPGVAGLFPKEYMSNYGLLDFLIDHNTYSGEMDSLPIDEYVYPVGEFCKVNSAGGEIYVVPACGSELSRQPDLYRKSLMRVDFDLPSYRTKSTPIDLLIKKLNDFIQPDLVFIDARSGIHQIGGITLTRYSDLAILFFYGNQQNVDGMKMVLPHIKKAGIPFFLVNSKIPANEELAKLEKRFFLEGAYDALCTCDEDYQAGNISIDDDSADHYPINISYNDAEEVMHNVDQLLKAYIGQSTEYEQLANAILEALPQKTTEVKNSVADGVQKSIVEAFSSIMGGLETAAAEDEFSTIDDLKKKFYPLKAFSFIFDTKKFLILGQKGVGKTALFSALQHKEYAYALAQYLKVETEQYERIDWIVGTSDSSTYTELAALLKTPGEIRSFWYYEIIRLIIEHYPPLRQNLPEKVKPLFDLPSIAIARVNFCDETAFNLSEALKLINEHCQSENKQITIIYDALDRAFPAGNRTAFLSTLVDIWYKNATAMSAIRSKIFLRKDIFTREIQISDQVKLRNYSSSIEWTYDQLFSMVWKRAISQSEGVKEWYFKAIGHEIPDNSKIGYVPVNDEKENKNILSLLIGTKMGSGNKASTYNWFRNRLADTQGVIVPRSMIDIFSSAARMENDLRTPQNLVPTKSIIRPRCFEDNLRYVSEKRVTDLKEEYVEYLPFFESVKDSIQRSPCSEDQLKEALEASNLKSPAEEIKKLREIGVIKEYQRKLSDPIRYHFPDIYLLGLGLQRAGMR